MSIWLSGGGYRHHNPHYGLLKYRGPGARVLKTLGDFRMLAEFRLAQHRRNRDNSKVSVAFTFWRLVFRVTNAAIERLTPNEES